MSKSLKGKIIKKYLSQFPKVATRTIARKILAENIETFKDFNNVRSLIRYYRGNMGELQRKRITDKSFFNKGEDRNISIHLPESHAKYPDKWYLPKSSKKVLLLSDIHIPYHDVEAIKLALNYGKEQGIDTIYLNGDILDFFMLSFHEKDAKKRPTIKQELELAKEFFKYLRHLFSNVVIYFKPGNHEYRLERYLIVKAPELLDCEEFKLDILLGLREFKIEYINKRTKTYFGHLLVEHGDRIKGTGGVNPARTLFTRYKRHAICGHFHRKSEHAEKIYDDKIISTFSTGCLCELEPEYFEVNNHVHGFAIIEMSGDNFKVRNFTIESGKIF